jgi:cytochrome o ubiquinol oxidase subunit 2
VVALQWKWLFIYPEQHIASVNFVQFPDQRPLNFQITADAPMNSFWIPKLGGQVYAMSGMSTQLHLMADKPGDYRGISANMSGEGFSGMKFTARASTQKDFDAWVLKEKRSGVSLDKASYDQLALPSKDNAATTYTLAKHDLYDTIVMKYMAPAEESAHTHSHEAASTSKHKDTQ